MNNVYVIQKRTKQWENKWETIHDMGRHKTVSEAQAVINQIFSPTLQKQYRVAEEYTVVRYRAVK